MINNLLNILTDNGYSDSDLISKILVDLNNLDLIAIRNRKPNNKIYLFSKYSKINKEKLNLYFESLDGEIKNYFPNLDYVRTCFNKNLKFPPKCPICGKLVTLMGNKNCSDFNKTCGAPECIKAHIEKESLLKYGTKHPTQNSKVKEKQKESFNKLNIADIVKKREETCIKKYGSRTARGSPLIKAKVRSTNIEKGLWTEDSGKTRKKYKETQDQLNKKYLRNNLKRKEKDLNDLPKILNSKNYKESDPIYSYIQHLISKDLIKFSRPKKSRISIYKNNISIVNKNINITDQINFELRALGADFNWEELKLCFLKNFKEVPLCPFCG